MHPAFVGAGQEAGVKIWRIENFEPKEVPQSEYGKFHEGDSYIVLRTIGNGSRFSWHIHFWLGVKTSVDEAGAAARLAVDLDDGLGGGPVQHREVQGHESTQFLEYFESGVRYIPGGVASGFHHVDRDAPGEKKLYHIKGKKNVRVHMVEPHVSSMNQGDCFILDNGKDLFIYIGRKANGVETVKARSVANRIRDQDYNAKAEIFMIDSSATEDEINAFFTELGSGSQTEIPEASAAGDDLDFEKKIEGIVTLHKISDDGGKMRSEKVGEKPMKREMLESNDCFILDTGSSGIYVWVGKGSNKQEKSAAMNKGVAFLKENNYPDWTGVHRIVEGAEPSAFKEYFIDWQN